jgi:hypothetical protein
MQSERAGPSPLRLRIQHDLLWRQPGTYAAFPLLERLPDGRLAVAHTLNRQGHRDHYSVSELRVAVSPDEAASWSDVEGVDPAVPFTWPGRSQRERHDRYAARRSAGSLVAAGGVGWETWPAARRDEAKAAGRRTAPHPTGDPERLMVGGHRLFAQHSSDGGRTWQRQEWELPRATGVLGFWRAATLADGTILLPLYEHAPDDPLRRRNLVLRSGDGGSTWRLRVLGQDTALGNEAALVEAAPDRVLALVRLEVPGYLLECWSEDAGQTWSAPVQTALWGYPPHLLRLRDGRLLCSVGVRRPPMGVQAFISADGGRSWDVAHPAVLRDDGETRDLGYPISVQLGDGSLLTAYYLTTGGVTHVATARWELPW